MPDKFIEILISQRHLKILNLVENIFCDISSDIPHQIKVEKKLLHVRLCRIGTPCLVSRLSSDTLVQSKHCESKEDFLFDPHKFTRSVWRLPSLRESRCFPQTPSTLFTLPAQRIISLISSSLLRKFPKSSFS